MVKENVSITLEADYAVRIISCSVPLKTERIDAKTISERTAELQSQICSEDTEKACCG